MSMPGESKNNGHVAGDPRDREAPTATASGTERPPDGPPPEAEDRAVSWSEGAIRLRDPGLFASGRDGACRSFLRRIFRMEEVRSVEIDRARATALIRYAPEALEIAEALARMAAAIGREPDGAEALAIGPRP